jgi:plasmid stability protein
MPTLYVRNVPSDLYEALRKQAMKNHRAISKEVIALLEQYQLKKSSSVVVSSS